MKFIERSVELYIFGKIEVNLSSDLGSRIECSKFSVNIFQFIIFKL